MTVRAVAVAATLACLLMARPSQAEGPTKHDCVSANENAQDLRHAGRLREARAQFSLCAAANCPRAVQDDCAARLAELEKAMPHVVLRVLRADRHPVTSASVLLDGVPLTDALDGTPIAVDPGAHRLQIFADGQRPFDETVVIDEGDSARRVEAVLEPVIAPSAPVVRSAPPRAHSEPETLPAEGLANASPAEAPASEAPANDRPAHLAIGLALGGAGVAFLVVGGVLAAVGNSTYTHALNAECGGHADGCSPQGASDGARAHTDAAAATVAVVAGAAFVAAGLAVVLTLPGGSHAALGAATEDRGVQMTLRGQW